jgi:DNA helicase HerA-like ATPase
MSLPLPKSDLQPMKEPSVVAIPQRLIGHIVSVSGPRAVAILETHAHAPSSHLVPRVQIGALLKISTPASAAIGLVTGISMPMPTSAEQRGEIALVELNLVGEITAHEGGQPKFRIGVSHPPTLGDPLVLADREDLTLVFAPEKVTTVEVGRLYQDSSVAASLKVDDLLAKHFIIVGSTGSGKSCALAGILQRILDDHKYAHIVVMDIHNEYHTAFDNMVERITLNSFSLPFWLLNFQELTAALTTNDEYRDAETEILSEGVVLAKRRYTDGAAGRVRKAAEAGHLTVESPTPFRLSDVIAYIDEQLGKFERTQNTLPYRKLRTRIETMIADQRYNFMFGSLTVQDTMADLLARLFRVPSDGKPITVIDLSVVPTEILDVVISLISRLAFDVAVWSKGRLPTLLVCEEAHRYAPAVDRGEFLPTRQALARIAKEGRKYGISLALVTQRPSELDSTILSQCSTMIALRLSSERDQQVMRSSAHEGMMDLLEFLPLLGDREAIIMGQGVSIPMRVIFDNLEANTIPRNLNAGFSKSWKVPNMDRAELENIVSRWRQTGRDKGERGPGSDG